MKLSYLLPAGILGIVAVATPAAAQYRGYPGPNQYEAYPAYEDAPTYEARGTWQLRGQTATSAHVLHERASHFADLVGALAGYAHISDDAYALSDAAMHFHHVVESGAPRQHALQDFARVQRTWRHVREEFQHAHELHHVHHLNDDWAMLTEAFAQTAHALREESHGSSAYGHAPPSYYRQAPRYRTPRSTVRVRVPTRQYRWEARW